MKVKKIPQRMCTGCMEMKCKKELLRIVRSKEGEISIDLIGKKPGRGAYICKNIECFEKSYKTKRLERNLGGKISEEIYETLKQQIDPKDAINDEQ
ncbi:RNase P modulator RnpM [Clostridium sp.]|uniref:RNase P modulator RnpM n=1 Tax=Clostridium sp. TaxID=1506 RepID=UPI003D6D31BE